MDARDFNFYFGKEISEKEVEFINTESRFINGILSNKESVALGMARDHRYLVNEKAKLYMEFFRVLANDYKDGRYDPRNEFACKCAKVMIDALEQQNLIYKPYKD